MANREETYSKDKKKIGKENATAQIQIQLKERDIGTDSCHTALQASFGFYVAAMPVHKQPVL
jgi:hypothetical protein